MAVTAASFSWEKAWPVTQEKKPVLGWRQEVKLTRGQQITLPLALS